MLRLLCVSQEIVPGSRLMMIYGLPLCIERYARLMVSALKCCNDYLLVKSNVTLHYLFQ